MEQIKANETLVDSSLRETKMHGTVDFPVGVYLDDFSDFKNGYICWHWHEEIQISWIIEGEFLCQMEGRTVHLHPGELIFVNRGVLHQIYPVQKGYGKLYAFIWDPEFLSGSAEGAVYQEAFEAMLKSGPRCLTLAETAQAPGGQAVGEALRAIVALYTQHPALYHLQIKILLSQIWLLLCRQEGEAPEPMTPERERDEERLKRAMNYMHAHYGEHFSLEELARQAYVRRMQLRQAKEERRTILDRAQREAAQEKARVLAEAGTEIDALVAEAVDKLLPPSGKAPLDDFLDRVEKED